MEKKPEIWKDPDGIASYGPCESLAFTPKAAEAEHSKTLGTVSKLMLGIL